EFLAKVWIVMQGNAVGRKIGSLKPRSLQPLGDKRTGGAFVISSVVNRVTAASLITIGIDLAHQLPVAVFRIQHSSHKRIGYSVADFHAVLTPHRHDFVAG